MSNKNKNVQVEKEKKRKNKYQERKKERKRIELRDGRVKKNEPDEHIASKHLFNEIDKRASFLSYCHLFFFFIHFSFDHFLLSTYS
uniref:IBB domain-containing protein n=1 Tax=Caenorhabditis tropicalis TaxID=1561998 RepID=A0A1I7U6T8_9PELO